MLIGRIEEQQELMRAYQATESKFVVVYGRRRVGKTYLVRQTFKDKFTFAHSGQANASLSEQLFGWCASLKDSGMSVNKLPKSWLEAFELLKDHIRQCKTHKKVIFIDELPWLDTPRSRFVNALEFFWNSWASGRDDVLLVVCGSATSWIVNKIFKNHGGLHNRVTNQIYLKPFTLNECEKYMKSMGLYYSRHDILEGYMVMGGIPYYWSLFQRGESMAQNIDRLFFADKGKLRFEFNELYDSLFRNPDKYVTIVKALGQNPSGLTREEIIDKTKIENGGNLSKVLEELEHCGFIQHVYTSPRQKNGGLFKLIDNYTLFYLKFMSANKTNDELFWIHNYNASVRLAWVGLAFERVCFQHIRQIKDALKIGGVLSNVYSLRIKDENGLKKGAQIDMLIDRADNTVNLCEMKFSNKEYLIDKKDSENLLNKIDRFQALTNYKKTVLLTMITPRGIEHNGYWSMVQNEVTADDLFKE
jgi:hypothetical protein